MKTKQKIFYKYKSLEGESKKYLIDSIKNSYFYFASPQQLNDSFEAYVKLDFTGTDEQKIAWAREAYTYDLYVNGKIPQGNIDFASKRYSPITNLREFNKCLAKDLNAPEHELLEFAKRNEKLLKENNKIFVQNEDLGILSLTTDCLNETMWGYYGNSGNGICLGYSLKKKQYGYFLPLIIDGIPDYHGQYIRKVHYTQDRRAINLYEYDDPFEKNMWTTCAYFKNKKWEAENEYRCVLTESFLQTGEKYRNIRYSKNILTEVIFGYKVNQKTINEIKEIINQNYENPIMFYQIQLEMEDIKLTKKIV